MARFTITINDNNAEALINYLKGFKEATIEKNEDMVEEPLLHPWHKKVIDERLKSVQENPEALIDWEVIKQKIKDKYGY